MRIQILVALYSVVFLLNTAAQQQLPSENKVVLGQDGKLYVNKSDGIYLWLSNSPDQNSKKIRLKSDSTKKFTNPMYFDTEGYNTVRSPSAVDTVTKKVVYPLHDIIFEIYSDGEPPITRINFKSSQSIVKNNIRYYAKNTKAVLKARDAVSGTDKIFYSTDNKAFAVYKDSLNFETEGEKILKYYSVDKVGNREEIKEMKFAIDNSPPETQFKIDGQEKNKFVSSNSEISLSANDNIVGVKAIYYKINNGAVKKYLGTIPVSWLGAKTGELSFWALDHLNNKSSVKTIGGKENALSVTAEKKFEKEFYADTKAPSLQVELDGAFKDGKYTYVSQNTKLKINAIDNESGVNQINYSINKKKLDKSYQEFIEFTDNGIAYIRINATDEVGNKSKTILKTYYVDNKAPKTKISVLGPKHKVKDTLYISAKTKLNIAASDNASGIGEVYYSINTGAEKKYEGAFTIEATKLTNVSYWGVDNVGNTENQNSFEVFVDNTPPDIYHHFSNTTIGTKQVREEQYTIYPTNALLYVAATDKESGGEKVTYKINKGPIKSTNPISGLVAGNYEVQIIARDILGNSTSQTIKFSIEN